MTFEIKTTYLSEGLARLIGYFAGKPGWVGYLTPFLEQVQDLENVLFEIRESRWLDNATYAQLDGIGDIVGEPRYGRLDDAYRLAIRVRILINQSRGTSEDIIAICQLLSGNKSTYIEPYYPAGYTANIYGISATDDPATWADYIEEATGAGIKAVLRVSVYPVFTWDGGFTDGDGVWGIGSWGTDGWGGVEYDDTYQRWDVGLWDGDF